MLQKTGHFYLVLTENLPQRGGFGRVMVRGMIIKWSLKKNGGMRV